MKCFFWSVSAGSSKSAVLISFYIKEAEPNFSEINKMQLWYASGDLLRENRRFIDGSIVCFLPVRKHEAERGKSCGCFRALPDERSSWISPLTLFRTTQVFVDLRLDICWHILSSKPAATFWTGAKDFRQTNVKSIGELFTSHKPV